ncbi:hypothetical protein ACX6XY_24410 [Streptomyces sp. O3]
MSEWLAQAHPRPGHVLAEWGTQALVLLPLGGLFSAVRIADDLVHAAAGSSEPKSATGYLTGQLRFGPVIHDGGSRHYYALVPADAGPDLDRPGVRRLGSGTWLGVPRLDRTQPPGPYWSVTPRSPFRLCRLTDVADLVNTGRARLTTLTAAGGTEAAR